MVDEIARFVNWLRRRNPQSRTWRDYGYDLKQFAAAVGDQAPEAVTLQDIDKFVLAQAARGLKPATINRRLAAIISFYTFLSDETPTLVCPVLPHRHLLRERQHLPRPVAEADLRQFFTVIEDSRDKAMFLLMLRCGLRISEVARLRLRDIYLDESPPRLLVLGKNSKERSVYLSPQAEQALRRYLLDRTPTPSDYVFLSYQGDGMSTTAIHKRLMRYRQEAGVTLTAHQLRHSFANDLVAVDVPVTSIQKLLGHSWLATTQTYIAANDRKVQADFYAVIRELEGWQ
ncbi:MAG: tyrosine-type recombinase/integrase [Anaerolineales bacterium]|nr:tyrosine-type recombinase/integrase [Anaerolineales bacterium]